MTAPSSGRDDATLRGAVVLVVAIIIGLALLTRGGGGGGDDEDASSDRSTEPTTTTAGTGGTDQTTVPIADNTSSTTTAPPADDPASTLVVVLNATTQGGWAGENAAILADAQYMTDDANFGGEDVETSQMYATPEAQAAAQAVAELLGLQVQVAEKPAEPLGEGGEDADADVVVVLGADSIGG